MPARALVSRTAPNTIDAGEVVGVEPNSTSVDVQRGGRTVRATIAIAGAYEPSVGDRVVLATSEGGAAYVLGVIASKRGVGVGVSGARASVERDPAGEVLRVRDDAGLLLFEHRPGERRSVVRIPEGNLEFRAEHGGISFVAATDVTIDAPRVDVRGTREVDVRADDGDGGTRSAMHLDARVARLTAPTIDARAAHLEVSAGEARLIAKAVSSAAESARHVVGALEVHATRIVERAREAFREVEGLSQSRAGRVRMIAETTFHLLGRRTLFKAEKDVKIKGEKIHLA